MTRSDNRQGDPDVARVRPTPKVWTKIVDQAASRPPRSHADGRCPLEEADTVTGSTATRSGVVRMAGHGACGVEYTVVGERAMFEGDIELGTVDELVRTMADVSDLDKIQNAAVVADVSMRWGDGMTWTPCENTGRNWNRTSRSDG